MSDGHLRKLFQKHLPEAHWQPIESWSTGQGVPDCEYCFPGGTSGWIENKYTTGWAVNFEPHQSAWHERRARVGGRTFVAIRRCAMAGPRRGPACDELWLYRGTEARALALGGLRATEPGISPLGQWVGGPAAWDWSAIRSLLVGK